MSHQSELCHSLIFLIVDKLYIVWHIKDIQFFFVLHHQQDHGFVCILPNAFAFKHESAIVSG